MSVDLQCDARRRNLVFRLVVVDDERGVKLRDMENIAELQFGRCNVFDMILFVDGRRKCGRIVVEQQFRGNGAAQVDHGYLGQLLDAFGDDLRGKTAQRREPIGYGMPFVPVPGRLIPPYGEVDIEGRDVGGAGLDDLRALQVAGQRGDRTVDLLVHFDEQVVDVRALLEGQADNAVSFAGLAAQVGQLRQLDELLPQRGDDGFIQLPGRKTVFGPVA